MNCCVNCFQDSEIRGFIFVNSNGKGKCDYCNLDDIELIDPRELEEMFLPLINIYKLVSDLNILPEEGMRLHENIQARWNIFKIVDSDTRYQLLRNIISGTYPEGSPILNEFVEISINLETLPLNDKHEKKWDIFAQEIKSSNRFFLEEVIDLELLKKLFLVLEKNYSKGKIFYRARITSKLGLEISEMGKPPADKTIAGRANPRGIPYLYVSKSPETTLYECRSVFLDFLTVGTFKLTDALLVVSLQGIDKISPFVLGGNIENFLIHQKYLSRLESELSKPLRRFETELDYLPTQYLCEYVKSLGYDAIEYGSSLHENGTNLAIFNDNKIICKSVDLFEIISNKLDFKKVSPE